MSTDENILDLIGRKSTLFDLDIKKYGDEIDELVRKSRFLVIGGAGSIGQSVSKEIFIRSPKALHVLDLSENNLVEFVRDIRSSLGYIEGDFRTFPIDCGQKEFHALVENEGPYDYILNLSALKHVRSEKDPYTLMRMIQVNILNSIELAKYARHSKAKNYFCVSTDKAANPVNMMGASKRIMEMFLMRESLTQNISMARFANVAFSDGSLLYGFKQRISKQQPITAPKDIKRYFITPQESGQLCLLSCLLGQNRDIFFPKPNDQLKLINLSDIASKYLRILGFEPYKCANEDEARNRALELIDNNRWPCYFFKTDTSGEKDFEEFYTSKEEINLEKFDALGIIKNKPNFSESKLDNFIRDYKKIYQSQTWDKSLIVNLFQEICSDFSHKEMGKNLEQKM